MKPIGYSLFVVKEDKRIYQYFRGANQEILIMQSWDIGDNMLLDLKEAENYHHQVAALGSEFEFLTLTDQVEILTGS